MDVTQWEPEKLIGLALAGMVEDTHPAVLIETLRPGDVIAGFGIVRSLEREADTVRVVCETADGGELMLSEPAGSEVGVSPGPLSFLADERSYYVVAVSEGVVVGRMAADWIAGDSPISILEVTDAFRGRMLETGLVMALTAAGATGQFRPGDTLAEQPAVRDWWENDYEPQKELIERQYDTAIRHLLGQRRGSGYEPERVSLERGWRFSHISDFDGICKHGFDASSQHLTDGWNYFWEEEWYGYEQISSYYGDFEAPEGVARTVVMFEVDLADLRLERDPKEMNAVRHWGQIEPSRIRSAVAVDLDTGEERALQVKPTLSAPETAAEVRAAAPSVGNGVAPELG